MADGRDIVLELIEQRKGDALKEQAADLDRLADKTDRTNKSMGDLGGESQRLSRRIEEQTVKVRELAKEIERGGGEDKGLFRQFRTAERDLGNLKRVAKSLEDIIPDVGVAGAKAGSSFMSSLSDAASAGGPELKAALMGAVAVSAPFLAVELGGIISGAVAGAVGVGGVVGGVAAAFQDPAVQSAADGFKQRLVGEFTDMGAQFVVPTIRALDTLEDAVGRLDLTHLFAPAVPYVTELADGVAGLVDKLGPGLGRAFEAAGPVISELAKDLPELGDAIGDALADITESEGTVQGMAAIMDVISSSIRGVGGAIAFTSNAFHNMADVAVPVMENIRKVTEYIPIAWLGVNHALDTGIEHWTTWRDAGVGSTERVAKAVSDAVTAMTASGGAYDVAATEARKLADANAIAANSLRDFHAAQMAATLSTLDAKAGVLGLKQAVKDHGASLSDNTQTGLTNQQMLVGLAGRYETARDNAIKNGVETGKANGKYLDQINRLQELAGKLGMNKDKVYELIGAYKSVPRGPFVTEFIQRYVTQGTPGEHSGGRIPDIRPDKKALGGRAFAGEPYTVGDGGRTEMFIPDTNGYIAPRVPASMSGGGSSGGGPRFATIQVSGNSIVGAIFRLIQEEVNRSYGGDVVVAFGKL